MTRLELWLWFCKLLKMPIHPLNKIWQIIILIIPWNFFSFFNKSYSKCLCWWSKEGHLCASYLNCICQTENAVTLPQYLPPDQKMQNGKKKIKNTQHNYDKMTWFLLLAIHVLFYMAARQKQNMKTPQLLANRFQVLMF